LINISLSLSLSVYLCISIFIYIYIYMYIYIYIYICLLTFRIWSSLAPRFRQKVLELAPFLLPYSILSLEGSFWRSLDSFGIPFGFILVARGTLFVPYVSPTRHGPLISILCLFSLVGIEWKQFLSNRLTIALLRWQSNTKWWYREGWMCG
jgi:hypothetical protein